MFCLVVVVSLFYSTVVTATVLTRFSKAARRRRRPVRGNCNLGWCVTHVALHISRELLRFRVVQEERDLPVLRKETMAVMHSIFPEFCPGKL